MGNEQNLENKIEYLEKKLKNHKKKIKNLEKDAETLRDYIIKINKRLGIEEESIESIENKLNRLELNNSLNSIKLR